MAALTWIAPGHERAVLLEQPATCLDPGIAPVQAQIGQALFNAPDLFGGQAARAGISCASCHANGRRSAAFFLGGISGEPGSADVSSSFFSLARADGRFDPKPIPDLALPGKIDRDPSGHALETFIRGLIVEEFSGREPSFEQLTGLADYVRAVKACPGQSSEPRNLARDLALLRTTIEGAIGLLDRHDAEGALVLVKAARFRLGLIDERMAGPKRAALHKALLSASFHLERLPLERASMTAWLKAFNQTMAPKLVRYEQQSLYNPQTLDRWLAGRR